MYCAESGAQPASIPLRGGEAPGLIGGSVPPAEASANDQVSNEGTTGSSRPRW